MHSAWDSLSPTIKPMRYLKVFQGLKESDSSGVRTVLEPACSGLHATLSFFVRGES